jgi:hypothetical protein
MHYGNVVQRRRLTGSIPNLPEDAQRLLVAAERRLRLSPPLVRAPDVLEHDRDAAATPAPTGDHGFGDWVVQVSAVVSGAPSQKHVNTYR